jgi:hypothetical protein
MVNGIIANIDKRIVGRITNKDKNYSYLAEIIQLAGDGDHLEIGTLFGGSAILVALLKKEYGYSGKVVCIDPLDGYYKGVKNQCWEADPIAKIQVNRKTLDDNLRKFGVIDEVEIIQSKSYPFPIENRRFASTYIDGNHWQDWPSKDWRSVKDITEKYVLFDDYTKSHPAVVCACEEAKNSNDWKVLFLKEASFALERIR